MPLRRSFLIFLICTSLILSSLLHGCSLPSFSRLISPTPTGGSALTLAAPATNATSDATLTPAGAVDLPSAVTITPFGAGQLTATPYPAITLWVPPEFDPAGKTPAGDLLAERLAEFSRQNSGVRVIVRVKAASGPGGLLESLNAASTAAPLVLPSVVALSRPDLETAALKGLVFPLDGASTTIDEPDWYDYARQLAMVQGATFALPFAGDVLVLAYRPAKVTGPPSDWPAVFRLSQPLAFSAGDNQALFVLSLYQASGGMVEDAQRRPTLQPELLSQVLSLLADGEQQGTFPYWLSQYETSGQVWQAYRDERVSAMVTWASNYLSSQPADTVIAPIPSMGDVPQTLATGWGWAISDPDPEHRQLSIKLAEFLSEGTFMAQWSEKAGYLPTRPSALAVWSNQSLKTLLSPIAISAEARPTVDQLASLGPVLKEATLKVLKREADPTQAAQSAVEKLQVPEAR